MAAGVSIVRKNLLTQHGYTPYCGDSDCRTNPRSFFNGEQFQCDRCGWRSSFEPEFIEKYKAFRTKRPAPLSGTEVIWPKGLEQQLGISAPTRWRWERDGGLPKRDVAIGGRTGWKPETISAALNSGVVTRCEQKVTRPTTDQIDGETRVRWVQTLGFAATSLRGDRAYMARIMGGAYKKASAYRQIETHEKTLAEIADFVKRSHSAK